MSGALPPLPVQVWDGARSAAELYRLLGAYWEIHREWFGRAEITADQLTGAVLATRESERSDPQRYCEVCLCGSRGLKPIWVERGRQWRIRERIRAGGRVERAGEEVRK